MQSETQPPLMCGCDPLRHSWSAKITRGSSQCGFGFGLIPEACELRPSAEPPALVHGGFGKCLLARSLMSRAPGLLERIPSFQESLRQACTGNLQDLVQSFIKVHGEQAIRLEPCCKQTSLAEGQKCCRCKSQTPSRGYHIPVCHKLQTKCNIFALDLLEELV